MKEQRERAGQDLGTEEVARIMEQLNKASESEKDGIITAMRASGLSQIEIKESLKVGGYRISRPKKKICKKKKWHKQKELILSMHAMMKFVKKCVIPFILLIWNQWVRGHIVRYRAILLIPQLTGRQFANHMLMNGNKQMPGCFLFVRWRECAHAFFPRLRLRRVITDLCNCCYRIKIQLSRSKYFRRQINVVGRRNPSK